MPWQHAWIHLAAAALARLRDEPDKTEQQAHDALRPAAAIGETRTVATCLELLGGLAAADGRGDEAARLLAAAQSLRDQRGDLVRLPPYRDWHEHDLAATRDLCVDHTVWEQGASLPWREAVHYAQRGRGRRKRPATGWASLTPTERQVAGLVAEGLPNQDVADQLFISVRTVTTHLSRIYGKLGISSRTELAAQLQKDRRG
jgi:DNA-binding CsgD family transcriptional regulator